MADQEHPDASMPWPEDTVEYHIYCRASEHGEPGAQENSLSRLAVECNFSCRQMSGCHVWHYSAFALWPAINGGTLIVFIWPWQGVGGLFPCILFVLGLHGYASQMSVGDILNRLWSHAHSSQWLCVELVRGSYLYTGALSLYKLVSLHHHAFIFRRKWISCETNAKPGWITFQLLFL